jgi:predicted outer membrane repeat protein
MVRWFRSANVHDGVHFPAVSRRVVGAPADVRTAAVVRAAADLRVVAPVCGAILWLTLAIAGAAAVPVQAPSPVPSIGAGQGVAAGGGLVRVPQDAATLQQAISQVANGGVVELAAGIYAAPAAGFKIGNAGKAFTVRAALGAAVALDGGGSHPVLVLRNSARSHGGLVVFQDLTFRNGGGGSPETSPGVTVDAGEARFVGCAFAGNLGGAGADGGGVKVRNGSDASFIGCTFTGNASPIAGGAMMVDLSTVEVLGGAFVANLVNLPGSDPTAHGGAIAVIDGTLYVSDALFQGNQAGLVGGAIYGFGDWTATPATPHTYVAVTRSTFQANLAAPPACCPAAGDPTGGAIHVEDQTTLDVSGSWFVANQAQFGGALDSYRALINVAGSTFQANRGALADAQLAVGGAICALSNDAVDASTAGGKNPRPAGVTVAGSLLQGLPAGGGPVGNAGGCLLVAGDQTHLYGQNGLSPNGTLDSNRAPVQITGSAFDSCGVQQNPAGGSAAGGAINATLVALAMDDSLVLESGAAGNGSGGGLFLAGESAAQITGTTFAGDTADSAGGGIFAGASDLQIAGASFVANQAGPAVAEPLAASHGAALYSIPAVGSQPHVGAGDASGTVAATTFSQNLGLPVWDVDLGGAGPVNTVQYEGNSFFSTAFGDRVYVDTLADPGRNGFDVGGLNSLVVNRPGGPTTVKSPFANQALGAPPVAGSLKAFPPAGSPAARSAPFLAYAWTGGGATLDGVPLPAHQGVIAGAAPGSHVLAVNGVAVGTASVAAPQCTTDPTLCLANDRFHVQVQWQLATGERGEGHPVALSGDTGYFWFFDPASVELMVKMVDGRSVNGRFWVFYGALSNVHYTLVVTDTVTGAVQAYVNPQGQLASVADTAAFLGTGEAPPVPPVTAPPPPPAGACAAGRASLCLGGRFRVAVAWRTSTGAGAGTAVPLTGDTGTFWFFDPAEVDLVVKVLDGTSINDHFWVFYAGLSNVQYTITVTDTKTGRKKTYTNPQGTLASVADTAALPGP